jgi:hypothetical protein
MEWLLIQGPSLDKQLLEYIETGGIFPTFPSWLEALADAFRVTDDPILLRKLRQLLLFGYKAEHEPTTTQLEEAQASFEETDRNIGIWDRDCKSRFLQPMFRAARSLVSRVVSPVDWQAIKPSHGPGAVFPSCKPSEKSKFSGVYASIESKYPYYDYFEMLPGFWPSVPEMQSMEKEPALEILTHLVAVPKDARGPRLICVHPKESIWIQQGQRRLLERAIAVHPSTRGRINFDDQTVNGALALTSSKDRGLTTLDLKEASDSMSNELVRFLFGDHTHSYLACSRATQVKLLDASVRPLHKFAPMGNALTFPVQSLVFWALVHAGIKCRYGVSCPDIYVFGDDILFPSVYYDGAVSALVRAGFRPNTAKTFRRGFFRESCGVDAYRGIDVTPIRLKAWDVSQLSNLQSLCSVAKSLRKRGFAECSSYLYSLVREELGALPLSNDPNCQSLVEFEVLYQNKGVLNKGRITF